MGISETMLQMNARPEPVHVKLEWTSQQARAQAVWTRLLRLIHPQVDLVYVPQVISTQESEMMLIDFSVIQNVQNVVAQRVIAQYALLPSPLWMPEIVYVSLNTLT